MKHLPLCLFTLLPVFASATATAQPSTAPVATPAPQNEDWRNVSHINGTPIKVGERGDYLHKLRRTNISSNPIGWVTGYYGLSVSHAVTDNVVIRADGNLFDFDGSNGYEVGASAPIYFRRAYSGPFLEPGVVVRSTTEVDCYDYCTDREHLVMGPEVMVGWHWSYDSGLNVAAALGAIKPVSTVSMASDDPEINGYFRVGYAF